MNDPRSLTPDPVGPGGPPPSLEDSGPEWKLKTSPFRYLRRYPDGPNAEAARARIDWLVPSLGRMRHEAKHALSASRRRELSARVRRLEIIEPKSD